jgi:hypothetical protein
MRVLVLGLAGLVIILAATVTLGASFNPFNLPSFLSGLVLVLATGIQRLRTVERFIGAGDAKRAAGLHRTAETTLNRLVRGRRVREETLTLVVHIWEVPLWYRKTFPYKLRLFLRQLVARPTFRWLGGLSLKPDLKRAAAVSLRKPTPSGVKFSKGTSLIGACLANNDLTEVITLNTSDPQYAAALDLPENEWNDLDRAVTHNLRQEDARKLARKYGQVIGLPVQDLDTGEAIGCVTISVQANQVPELQLTEKRYYRKELATLAVAAASLLVK